MDAAQITYILDHLRFSHRFTDSPDSSETLFDVILTQSGMISKLEIVHSTGSISRQFKTTRHTANDKPGEGLVREIDFNLMQLAHGELSGNISARLSTATHIDIHIDENHRLQYEWRGGSSTFGIEGKQQPVYWPARHNLSIEHTDTFEQILWVELIHDDGRPALFVYSEDGPVLELTARNRRAVWEIEYEMIPAPNANLQIFSITGFIDWREPQNGRVTIEAVFEGRPIKLTFSPMNVTETDFDRTEFALARELVVPSKPMLTTL